jgi:hypothetical protein
MFLGPTVPTKRGYYEKEKEGLLNSKAICRIVLTLIYGVRVDNRFRLHDDNMNLKPSLESYGFGGGIFIRGKT